MTYPSEDEIDEEAERRLGWASVVVMLLLFGLLCHAVQTRWDSLRVAPAVAQTPQFDAHCRSCKQCGGGLLDENGVEQGLCEEGFRLWRDDLRKAVRR